MQRHHKVQIILFSIYILIVTTIMIIAGIGIDPSRYIFVLLIPAFFLKRTKTFLLDWMPFLFLFLSYEFLRGLTPFVNPRANYFAAINFDKFFFGGQIPTITLQNVLFNPHHLGIVEYGATMFYFLHLALPYVFAFYLWIINRHFFKRFTLGIILLSYAGWLTFVLFPAAPPWLASQHDFLPHIYRVIDYTSASFPEKLHLPSIYHDFYPNNVAAIPSMHAAYPLIVFLFGLKFFKRKFLWFGLYVLGVWFSLIYLGEHYVLDVILGAIYAFVFYKAAEWIFKNKTRIEHKMVQTLPFTKILLAPGNNLE